MKKLLKKSLIFLMLVALMPLASFLVACGATPGETINGVSFVSDMYDEETGKAIFEVDLNVDTKLPYKWNPSSAKPDAEFTIPVEGQTDGSKNRDRYTFIDGVINVYDKNFEQIEIRIKVSGYTDQCIIRLKEYPESIRPLETSVVLNAGSSYTICAVGTFKTGNTTEERLLSESEYNFTVVTESEPVISVPNENRLTVCSLLNKSGTTTVTVTLNDRSGKSKGMSFKVEFTVVEAAKEMFLRFDNFSNFVEDGDTIEVDANKLTANAQGEYELHYKAFVISDLDTFIENVGEYRSVSSDNEYVSFDDENQIIKIKSDYSMDLDVTIYTDLFRAEEGEYLTLKIKFTIKYTAPTTP